MADDQTNPYVTMGMAGMMMPNPYIQPQWQHNPLPIPGFRGTPTDAQGKPIQSFLDAQAQHDAWTPSAPTQGTTLNSLPASGSQAPPYDSTPAYGGANPIPGGGWGSVYQGMQLQPRTMRAPPQQAQPAQSANPIDMRQAYLDALANPGKVTTPGATIQPSQPLGTPNVLDAFLANHPSGPAAPAGGGYSNKPFFDTLAQLRSA